MKKYHHLLQLRRSKGQLISNRRWVHQTSPTESNHLHRHPQTPPPPSSYSHLYRNTYSRTTIVSHHRLKATHSNLTGNHYHFQLSTLHTSKPTYHQDTSSQDYQVVVKDREFISAAVMLGNQHWIPLSNLDLLLPPLEVGLFFCYKKKDNTDMSPETVVKTIKSSLAGALSTFYPLAGEIVPNGQGEPEVLCNNNGVEFIHAHADIELKDLDFFHPDNSVRGKLVPKINRGVFSVQATELKCGAIVISCAIHHQVGDAYSLHMFLVAWAKYARLETISNIPSFRRSVLNPRHPPCYGTSIDNLYMPMSMLPPPSSFEEPLQGRIYYINAESIKRLQSEASTEETKRSKLISFTAFLWKLLAHGEDKAMNTASRMGIVTNGRRFLSSSSENSSSFDNHFGNVLSIPYGVAANNDLKAMPLHEVAGRVRRFVTHATKEEHFRELVDWVEMHRPNPTVARIYFGLQESEGEAVVVSDGQGLPITDMDFGWGRPEFGSYHFPWGSQTGYVATVPTASRNGDWVVYMHLKEKDFKLIDRMAHHLFTPLTHSLF